MSTKFYVGQKDYIAKLNEIDDLLQGVQGEPGQGVPVGGTTGQVLSKSGEADYATAWVAPPSSGREILTASRTYYVRKDGSDSNTGLTDTAGGAFLTIQRAVNILAAWDFGGNPTINGTVRIADGTYDERLSLGGLIGFAATTPEGWRAVSIIGNEASPQNVVIRPPSGSYTGVIVVGSVAAWYMAGFHMNGELMANYGTLFTGLDGSRLILGAHKLTLWSGLYGYGAYGTGTTIATGYVAITLTGACRNIAYCGAGAVLDLQISALTLVGVAVAKAFLEVESLANVTFYCGQFIGSVTGRRFSLAAIGKINTFGSGISHVPGSIAGTVEAGGVYA